MKSYSAFKLFNLFSFLDYFIITIKISIISGTFPSIKQLKFWNERILKWYIPSTSLSSKISQCKDFKICYLFQFNYHSFPTSLTLVHYTFLICQIQRKKQRSTRVKNCEWSHIFYKKQAREGLARLSAIVSLVLVCSHVTTLLFLIWVF